MNRHLCQTDSNMNMQSPLLSGADCYDPYLSTKQQHEPPPLLSGTDCHDPYPVKQKAT